MTITPITYTAADVSLGPLMIDVLRPARPEVTATDPETGEEYVVQEARPAILRFKRVYRLVDADGEIVRALPSAEIRVDVTMDEIPNDIKQALVALNTWTKNRARIDAGLVETKPEA
jgi:hypothetical protein